MIYCFFYSKIVWIDHLIDHFAEYVQQNPRVIQDITDDRDDVRQDTVSRTQIYTKLT